MMTYAGSVATVPACAAAALVLREGLYASARRLANAVRSVRWREARARIGDHVTFLLLFFAAGKHAGNGRMLPAPPLDPCPWEPAEPPASGGTMPSTWQADPGYISPAMAEHVAQRPTQTYDLQALLAAAEAEAQDELERWWLS
jgi:hypothetical protein